MIEIRNKRNYEGPGVYVGRPTPLGNPFKESEFENGRVGVVTAYRAWLKTTLMTDALVRKFFFGLVDIYREAGKLTLICWCAPLLCHAEVIREMILEVVAGDKG